MYADRYLDSSWGFAMGWNYTLGAGTSITSLYHHKLLSLRVLSFNCWR